MTKFQDVFGEHPDKVAIGFLPYWDDRKVIYCANAIRSFDSNLEAIARLAEENSQLREALRTMVDVAGNVDPDWNLVTEAEKLL